MIALAEVCSHEKNQLKRNGRNRNGSQRWKCECGKSFSDKHVPSGPLGNMRSDEKTVFMALKMMADGSGVLATSRITGLSKKVLLKAIQIVGEKCERFFHEHVKNVHVNFCEIDEQWQYVSAHEKVRTTAKVSGYVGDCYSYYGICAESKMILAYESGRRTLETTQAFLQKLRRAIEGRVQITSDGYGPYKHGVPFMFLSDVDYAILIKRYKSEQVEKRYSPATIESTERIAQFGNPDMAKCATSYIERFNLTVRTKLKRFNRLTLGYSKCIESHLRMLDIFMCMYSFCTVHSSVKTTPAIAAGVTNRKWTLKEICEAVS